MCTFLFFISPWSGDLVIHQCRPIQRGAKGACAPRGSETVKSACFGPIFISFHHSAPSHPISMECIHQCMRLKRGDVSYCIYFALFFNSSSRVPHACDLYFFFNKICTKCPLFSSSGRQMYAYPLPTQDFFFFFFFFCCVVTILDWSSLHKILFLRSCSLHKAQTRWVGGAWFNIDFLSISFFFFFFLASCYDIGVPCTSFFVFSQRS